jgi:membrane protease YdiL (CAAX protease family)
MTSEMPGLNPEGLNPEIYPAVTPVVPAPPPVEKRVWGGWATAGFGAIILFAFTIVQTVVVIICLLANGFSGFFTHSITEYSDIMDMMLDLFPNLGLAQSLATIFSGIAGVGLIIAFIKVRERAGVAEYLCLPTISIKGVFLSVVVVIGFLAASAAMNLLLETTENEQIMYDLYETSVWPPLFWISVIIFAPVFEEVLFRGFLFEGFRQSRLGAVGAIGITSVFWALLHAFQYSLISVGWILFMGIVIGIVRLKTKNLWNTIIIHALVNAVATVEIALNVDRLVS